MGGNAMKHVGVERKSAEDYFVIANEVLNISVSFAKKIELVPAYSQKESFGDMDLVFVGKDGIDLKEQITKTFKPKDIKKNGDVWSFDYRKLQIDLIEVPEKTFYCALTYFSYNDLGNLIGRVAHKMGLKYGHNGLILPIKSNNSHLIGNVEISVDCSEIFDFLGYNYKRFLRGFNTLDEIFWFVVSSRFFNKDSFQLENLNHINRKRNRKRPTFMKFLNWLDEHPEIKSYEFSEDKSIYIENALKYFEHNGCRERLNELLSEHRKKEFLRSKFNGRIVSQITGLTGESLGKFMKMFADSLGTKTDFEKWLLDASQNQIESKIRQTIQQ